MPLKYYLMNLRNLKLKYLVSSKYIIQSALCYNKENFLTVSCNTLHKKTKYSLDSGLYLNKIPNVYLNM